eukprot:SM000016S01832  [mRNA]  locus=s16:104651:108872:+ [translate_table: standard]
MLLLLAARGGAQAAAAFLLGLAYLAQLDDRQKEKLRRRIRAEEKRAAAQNRPMADTESAQWLNTMLERVWPIVLERFISEELLPSLAPWFFEKNRPWHVKKVLLKKLHMGSSPPYVAAARVYSCPQQDDHAVLELAGEFVASHDMSAIISSKARYVGMWTTFHVTNVHLEGKLRIGLKFVSGWPYISRARLSFAGAPYVSLMVRPLASHGIDVSDLPGVAGWLDRLLATALETSLVEPNMLVIDVQRLVGRYMTTTTDEPRPSGNFFHVEEREAVAELLVEVIEATNLKISDANGFSDPFVKGALGGARFKSAVKYKTLNPKWYEEFRVPLATWDLPNLLILRVRDKDPVHFEELGYCVIDLAHLRGGQRHDLWLPLQGAKTGRLHLAITVHDHAHTRATPPSCPVAGSPLVPDSAAQAAAPPSPLMGLRDQEDAGVDTVAPTQITPAVSPPRGGVSSSDVVRGVAEDLGAAQRAATCGQAGQQQHTDSAEVAHEEASVEPVPKVDETVTVNVGFGDPGAVAVVKPGSRVFEEGWKNRGGGRRGEAAVKAAYLDGEGLYDRALAGLAGGSMDTMGVPYTWRGEEGSMPPNFDSDDEADGQAGARKQGGSAPRSEGGGGRGGSGGGFLGLPWGKKRLQRKMERRQEEEQAAAEAAAGGSEEEAQQQEREVTRQDQARREMAESEKELARLRQEGESNDSRQSAGSASSSTSSPAEKGGEVLRRRHRRAPPAEQQQRLQTMRPYFETLQRANTELFGPLNSHSGTGASSNEEQFDGADARRVVQAQRASEGLPQPTTVFTERSLGSGGGYIPVTGGGKLDGTVLPSEVPTRRPPVVPDAGRSGGQPAYLDGDSSAESSSDGAPSGQPSTGETMTLVKIAAKGLLRKGQRKAGRVGKALKETVGAATGHGKTEAGRISPTSVTRSDYGCEVSNNSNVRK